LRKIKKGRAESMETWRFIPYETFSPAVNMAIDEAIMHLHSQGKVPPTLRFYGWNPATLSIGYFQKVQKEVDLNEVANRGLGFVRRITGGRAVLHDRELTYSVIVSEDHPRMPKTVSESYRVISQGLLEGFRLLGLQAYLSPPARGKMENLSAACFDSPSDYELVVAGKKVAGSAQTRQRGVILQHGSILLDVNEDLLFAVLKFPTERVRERLKASFREKAVAINRLLPVPVGLSETIHAFYEGFQKGMGIRLEKGSLTKEEWDLVRQLVAERYGTKEWNMRR
jgi:lipoate-protein ligase A